jgi:hypothetical protein
MVRVDKKPGAGETQDLSFIGPKHISEWAVTNQ